ncbi:MAG TPA: DUF1080 domain-containing protein [Puia sp.]|nr:DUF1080 domain-containing protein [Puia sp.]
MKKLQTIVKICAALVYAICMFACSGHTEQHNILTDQERKDGWTLIFDGTSLNGWHLFNTGNIPSAWSADSGNLVCNPHAKNVKHGDLVSDKEYENFELSFDWKISKAGNSGVFINVQERPELGTTFSTGPEYQLLDDKNMDADYLSNRSHKAASIFGVIPNNRNVMPNSGEWNKSKILQQNGKVTFWLNGVQTIQADFKSDDWKKQVAASSLSNYPEFGMATKGHIALQDWTNGISFRDIKIKEL